MENLTPRPFPFPDVPHREDDSRACFHRLNSRSVQPVGVSISSKQKARGLIGFARKLRNANGLKTVNQQYLQKYYYLNAAFESISLMGRSSSAL